MRGRRNLALTKEPSSNPGMNSQKSIGQDSQLSIESGAGSKTQSQILIKNKMLQKDHIKEVQGIVDKCFNEELEDNVHSYIDKFVKPNFNGIMNI